MAVWSIVNFLALKSDTRLDAEYYQPLFLQFESLLKETEFPIVNIGSLVKEGYRVVYENTRILDEDFDSEYHVKFLQAANVLSGFPTIEQSSMGWVSRNDWNRYPQGRMKPGEILIEVKGKAEKVAMVPDDFLGEVLVTGTLYKMLIDEEKVDRHYVFVYLLSKFGYSFRDRGKTNTLISYVNKDDLYSIPIPIVPRDIQAEIAKDYQRAYSSYERSKSLYTEAEALLLHELGLDTLDLSTQKTYVANFSETMEGDRFDAEYFHPEKRHIQEQLNAMPGESIGYYFTSVNELLHPPAKDTKEKVYNYDLTHALRFFLNKDDVDLISTHELGSTKKRFQQNDIVISRLRSYLEEIAIVKTDSQFKCVGSSEFFIFRSISQLVSPELLLVYLRSSPIQKVLKWCQDGSNHPRFKDAELLELKFPNCLFNIQKEVQDLIHQGIGVHQEAKVLLEQAKHRVEQMIVGEHAADEYPS